ncbi:MAG: thioredoxin-disulfide reductase [Candidatus Micrarchaeota archaeon]|nr:thioredoxin-disulfide reductase [Candidatus Micrarchaeota archaeon]MDE1823922.1 thioredoxin-disulfide reductase [Candidatus Micrarchaeota archaeon]MDE1849336.1 thioredoxin-disulfide reductase [Candidatus Micrarchaeota archaeon]
MAEKVLIIGGGPAGLSAAIYAAREGFEPLVIAGFNAGGQLLLTTVVENFPAFPNGVNGPDIISLMRKQAEKFGARFIDTNVSAVDLDSRPFKVTTDDKTYEAHSLIIATGANAKMLGLDSETRFMGKGVSSCATCDGPFFKGKNVIVVGGGDTAMEDSLFLTKFAESVTIIHRRDSFRASKIMQERVLKNPKVKVLWNMEVLEILGNSKVTGIRLKNNKTNEESELECDGVFVAIGYSPNTEAFKGKLKTDELGYLATKDEVLTEIEGVYVAGDVSDRFYRQAATASGSGVKAALHVREYLMKMEK